MLRSCFALIVAISLCCFAPSVVFVRGGDVPTEEITVNSDDWFYSVNECSDSSSLRCWTAPTTYRISSETEKESPYTANRSGLKLSAAANEFEAFQVALKSNSGHITCTAALSDFSPPLGSSSERRVELHNVGYHPTKKLADSLNRLPNDSTVFPVEASADAAATVLWVRVYVPDDAVQGEYTANLVISSSGSTLVTIPVTLTVFGFKLPVSATFKTQINIPVSDLQPSFLSDAVDKLDWAKQFLLEYRMTPKSVAWPSGLSSSIAWDNTDPKNTGRCTSINDEDYENLPYSAGKNTKRWAIAENWPLRRWMVDSNSPPCDGDTCPVSIRSNTGFSTDMLFQFPSNSQPRPSPFCDIPIGNDFGTNAYNEEWSEFIAALDTYVSLPENQDLASRAYIYVQNEPQDDNDAKLANHLCNIYKSAAPNIKIAISEEAKPAIAERTDNAGGPCGYDLWIAHVPAYDKEYAWQRLVDYGEESWFYSLPQDGGAYFSPSEDDIAVNDGMNIRVITWTAFVSRIRGWAYYNMGIFFEGSGPIRPKISAELFRDAMEDYEYLFLANGQKQPMPNVAERVDPVANAVGFSFTAWLRDHAQFAALRHELGRFIDGSRGTLAILPQQIEPPAVPIHINFQDPSNDPVADPLDIDGNTFTKVGWEAFDLAKGYGWSGHGFDSDNNPDFGVLKYDYRSGGANSLEESYIYNDWGRENQFDYAVANGKWTVTVAVGYPNQARSDVQDVTVNGVTFNDLKVTNVQYFTQEVDVTAGYLNIKFGKTFDNYCFISHFYAIPEQITAPTAPFPTAPSPPTAPAPTAPSPTTDEDEDGDGNTGCFSRLNTVEVEGKGLVSMESLKIGDNVLAAKGTFSRVYSFGHLDRDIEADFVQIHTVGRKTPLEASPSHMVFVAGKTVRADQVKIGDMLGENVVVNIRSVKRRGVFAPVTYSGKIVVSGVLASSYVALLDDFSPGSQNAASHAICSLHRLVCYFNFGLCEEETYTDGISDRIFLAVRLVGKLNEQVTSIQVCVWIAALPAMATLYCFEQLVLFPFIAVTALIVGFFWKKMNKTNKSTLKSL